MNTVDTHTHGISDDPQRYPITPLGGEQSDWSKEHPATTQQLIDHMDRAGVDQAVLVQGSTVYGYDNSYVIDSVAAHPDRLIGVCCIDAAAPDAPDTLREMVQERGMSGVRMFTQNDPSWIDQDVAQPFWREAARLEVPVNVALHHSGLSNLASAAEQNPDVRILLDHLANSVLNDGPPYAGARSLFDLARYPNLWLKFSTYNLHAAQEGASTGQQFFGHLVEAFGANRIMWGSNFPASWGADPANPYRELVDLARSELSFLDEEQRGWLLGGTARTAYPELAR
jgi:L-fuconolactonase